MKRLLAILTALLLCFPFLPIGGPQALADGSGCFLSGSFPSVYNEVLKRDFLTGLTQIFKSAIPTFISSATNTYLISYPLSTSLIPSDFKIFFQDSISGSRMKYPFKSESSKNFVSISMM